MISVYDHARLRACTTVCVCVCVYIVLGTQNLSSCVLQLLTINFLPTCVSSPCRRIYITIHYYIIANNHWFNR